MSYIENSLAQNETLLYRGRFPWLYHAAAWLVLIAAFAVGIVAYAFDYGRLAAVPPLIGIAVFVWIMYPVWTIEIGVTNQRLIYKRGLLWRNTQELQLRAIEEVSLDQGIIGRILDFGRIQLHGTGVGHVRLPVLDDPLGLRRALQDGMAAAQPGNTAIIESHEAVG